MNAPFQINEKNPIIGRRRNPIPISEEFLPPHDAIDREIDDAVQENRPADYERLRVQYYAGLSDKVPDQLPQNPAERAEAIASYGDFIGKEEFQHRVMHRLLARQFQLVVIAQILGISVRHTYRLKDKLKKKYEFNIQGTNFHEYVGKIMWDYDEWIASLLRVYDDSTQPTRVRIAIIRAVNEVNTSKLRFMNMVGFFKNGIIVNPREEGKAETGEADGAIKLFKEVFEECYKKINECGDASVK